MVFLVILESNAASDHLLCRFGVSVTASGLLPATSQGFIYFVLLNALAGLATPYYNTLVMAMIQQSFEPSILGRVLGVFNSLMSLPGQSV